jgi:hypothetical protein
VESIVASIIKDASKSVNSRNIEGTLEDDVRYLSVGLAFIRRERRIATSACEMRA